MTATEALAVGGGVIMEGLHMTSSGCDDCSFSRPDGCSVYETRPFMCRLFGTVPDEPKLRCPHGAKPARPLSPRRAAKLTERYIRIMQEDEGQSNFHA